MHLPMKEKKKYNVKPWFVISCEGGCFFLHLQWKNNSYKKKRKRSHQGKHQPNTHISNEHYQRTLPQYVHVHDLVAFLESFAFMKHLFSRRVKLEGFQSKIAENIQTYRHWCAFDPTQTMLVPNLLQMLVLRSS